MSTPERTPPKPIRLALIAVIFAVIIILCFGVYLANFNLEGPTPPIAQAAVTIEVLCLVGLFVLTIVAIARRGNPK